MDVSFPLDKAKKKKFRKKQNANKSRKGINNLPDPILQHILSYLSTKEAVRTSILSKRWKYLWTSIPKIDFNEGAPDRRMMFMKFVERVLALHGPSNIKRFSLSCNVQYDTSCINGWMRSVVKHKVQVLDLYLRNFQEPLALPPCLFTCESLEVLILHMFHSLKLPSSISFSCLKKLTLEKVIFSDDHSTQQLFTGCPILEDLFIIDCIWKYVKAVCISSPMLRRLFISDRYLFNKKYGENDDKDDLNADADENDSNGCLVVILGTSLEWFAFDGELINDYCFYNSSSIVDASIEAFERNEVDCYQDAHRVFKLLSGLSSVEKLAIYDGTVQVLNHAEELFAHLPVFYKLTRLSLESLETLFTCGAVQTILQNSPCLDFLEFQMVVCLPAYDQNYDWVLDPVPACFATHLKTIKISEFPRDENEMNAVNIFVESASVLERIVIGCDEYVAIQREEGGLKEAKGNL
ncbi:F-box protein At4g22280-like [Quercus robur]|uniref:F-box protein At4g22280-like n=1 Tax=Quercus robur TaxID=38942 RepID=UPI00216184DF|nr:F-box protein At4g22280-like [Quercus robur]XP_050288655.1 F-box protein At4g22280-like [Quercus robur]